MNAQSIRAQGGAQLGIMSKPKSKAVAEYRAQISRYLLEVMEAKGWKQEATGKAVGVSHTTIGRALAGNHTISFPTLLVLSDETGVAIPDELLRSAVAAQQPTTREANGPASMSNEAVDAYVRDVTSSDETVQRAVFEALQQRFGKTG